MSLIINQSLTLTFACVFILGLIGFVFRFMSNKNASATAYTRQEIDFEQCHILDLALIFKGELMAEDVSSLVISWAEKGFIALKSREINKGNIEISIAKLKNLPEETKPFEKLIFSDLLKNPTDKSISHLKFDHAVFNEKARKLQESQKWVRLNIHNAEFNKRFSKIFEDIKQDQEKAMQNSTRAIHKKFTWLELFISTVSLIMLFSVGLMFMDASKNDVIASYSLGALGLLCAGFLFGGFYYIGRKWNFRSLIGIAGMSYLIYLTGLAYQTNYLETGTVFFEHSYRYAGFIFGSILAFLVPKAKALTLFGKQIKHSLILEKKELCQSIGDQNAFFKCLPRLILFHCVEKAGKNLSVSKPDWYEGRVDTSAFDFNTFVEDIYCLGTALKNLALKKTILKNVH